MNVLLVHAHPEADSFVTAMRDTIAGAFAEAGATVAHSDLYAMGFNPVLSAADFGSRRDPDHVTFALEQRHNHERGTLAPDIAHEIAKVQGADTVVLTFPLFWFGVPAILKGWIDRVFVSGAFYGGRRIYGAGGMRGKRALAALSLGGREHMFGPGAIHGELETGMLRPLLQGSLGYVGFDVLAPFVAYHTPYIGTDERARILDGLRDAILAIDTRATLPMPDLAAFDESFKPVSAAS